MIGEVGPGRSSMQIGCNFFLSDPHPIYFRTTSIGYMINLVAFSS